MIGIRFLTNDTGFTNELPHHEPDSSPSKWNGPRVEVLNAVLADATQDSIVEWLVEQKKTGAQCIAYALHVGGLLALDKDDRTANVLNQGSLLYADGVAATTLAKNAGATVIERSATTDIGPRLLAECAKDAGPARVAFIGGPNGLAQAAAEALETQNLATPVFIENGFHADWLPVLDRLRDARPEIIFIGLGAPREMFWCEEYKNSLPDALIITCGGWFGFLAGNEKRAPRWLQRVGGEWFWRLVQSPRRLIARYSAGALLMLRLRLRSR